MNVLGLDTSTAATAACLLRSDGAWFELRPDADRLARPPGHARELMPGLARVMEEGGLAWPELDAIAVGRGPGTFTGLRIGIATARALAQATSVPLRPVSSLAALAAGAEAPLVLPVIDARRGEVFAALYEHGRERWPPLVGAPEAVAGEVRREGLRPLAVGDGSLRFRPTFEAADVEVAPAGSSLHVVRALCVCRLAADVPPVPPEAVVPDYLRVPDAKSTA